jgi:hypothetical protein
MTKGQVERHAGLGVLRGLTILFQKVGGIHMSSDACKQNGSGAPGEEARSFFDLPVYQDNAEEALERHNIAKLL